MSSIRIRPRTSGGWGQRRWLADDVGGWGELTWSTLHRGGCHKASWTVESTRRLPYRPGDRVEIVYHGWPIWAGTLNEPDGDTMHASGLYYQGDNARALNSAGAATVNPDAALFGGVNTRGLLNWTQLAEIHNADFGVVSAPMSVNELLTGWAESVGKVVRVNGRGEVVAFSNPTVPRWHITPGAAQLTVAEDSYVTTIFGRYLDSTSGLYSTVSATDATAAARFGPREKTMDLSPAGAISSTEATAIITQRLAMGAARPGWANSLEVAAWELTSPGEGPANLRSVKGGDLIRLQGQMDMTIATGPLPYIDVIADEVTYVDGSDTINIKPVGLEARNLTDVLTLAVA